MKRVLLLIVAITFLIYPGCQNGLVEKTEVNKPVITSIDIPDLTTQNEPVEIRVYYKSIQNLSDMDWNDYIREEYGITIEPIQQIANNGTMIIVSLLEKNDLNGLFALFDNEYIEIIPEISNYALPLGRFLANIQAWESLPFEYKASVSVEGETWAIPMQYKPYGDQMKLRIYNQDILDQINADVPATIPEFFELMKSVYDSGSVEHVVPVDGLNPFYTLYDVFWSFGVPISCSDNVITSIQYDYIEKQFKDYANESAMKEALSFIKQLYDTHIISVVTNGIDLNILFDIGKVFSIQSNIYERLDISNTSYKYTFMMDEHDNKLKVPVDKSGGVYVLLKDTEQPELILKRLINDFLSTEEGNMIAYLGNDKSKYSVNADSIVYDGKLYGGAPALFRSIISDKMFMGRYISSNKISNESILTREKQYRNFIDMVDPSRLIGINTYYDYLRTSDESISSLFSACFLKIFNSEVSIDEIYGEYNDEMRKSGGIEYLEKLNEKVTAP